MEQEEDVFRPRTLDTAEYVRAKLGQIVELLEVVNSVCSSADDVSAPRTLFQRLPRHMRRRAMSHNIKRLPRQVRPFAVMKHLSGKKRKKMPSRIWRRRAARLIRRSMAYKTKERWLSTHIWHAKRFHMTGIWGFKLAVRSCQKTFRSNYRSSLNYAVVIDRSYLSCMQFKLSGEEGTKTMAIISNLLARFCRKEVSATFNNPLALSGQLEVASMLFNTNGFIGPCRFSWFLPSNLLNLWIHPSMEEDFLKELTSLEENIFITSDRNNYQIIPENKQTSKPIELCLLRNRICRFQLIGKKALLYLNNVLRLTADEELRASELFSEFLETHKWWRNLAKQNFSSAATLRSGTQISLIVEDPRLFRAERNSNDSSFKNSMDCCSGSCGSNVAAAAAAPPPPPQSLASLWNWRFFEAEMLPKRLSNSEFEKLCGAGKLTFPQRTDFKVPILLVLHAPSTSAQNPLGAGGGIRVDFLCPSAVGFNFWVALQFAKCRAIGLQNWMHLNFEGGIFAFPDDCADSPAGRRNLEEEAKKYSTNRENLKTRNVDALRFKYCSKKLNIANGEFCVVRERLILNQLNAFLKTRQNWIESGFDAQKCLVPVSLKMSSKGVAKRFALIYLKRGEESFETPAKKQSKIDETESSLLNRNCAVVERKTREICDFVPISEFATVPNGDVVLNDNGKIINKQICLNELFPQTNKRELKTHRNRRKREKRKKKVTSKKPENGGDIKEKEEAETRSKNVAEVNDEREPIGLILRGNYSLIEAQGVALGYVLLPFLKMLGPDNVVLIQNNSSGPFYEASLEINSSAVIL